MRSKGEYKVQNSVTLSEIQKIWDNLPAEFRVYEKVYLIPITHLKSKGSLGILADLKDYAEFKTPDYHMFTGITKTIEDRRPNEFIVMNNFWYLDNKPVLYKGEQAKITDVPDLPEFCLDSFCPLFRDLDENGQKYYYINEDDYDRYLREKAGKLSKIDEIIEDSMKFVEDEDQSILDEKERKVLNNLS